MQLYDYTISYYHGKETNFVGGAYNESKSAFHIDVDGCDVIIPFKLCSGVVVEQINKS